ncbi:MAG: hypothetical protein CVV03_09980 [Firmicutes bacterium HGW-Firmicutes-8]|nr:MAG: hypothetical protein CVV03_09980 [Firmicutes bacterium HGW-Firmicutes-8]
MLKKAPYGVPTWISKDILRWAFVRSGETYPEKVKFKKHKFKRRYVNGDEELFAAENICCGAREKQRS